MAGKKLPEAYYRIHSLLHSMQAIARHEDDLCALMNEIGREGALNSEVSAELRALLEELPSTVYADDVEAVWRELQTRPRTSRTRRHEGSKGPGAKTGAKSRATGKAARKAVKTVRVAERAAAKRR